MEDVAKYLFEEGRGRQKNCSTDKHDCCKKAVLGLLSKPCPVLPTLKGKREEYVRHGWTLTNALIGGQGPGGQRTPEAEDIFLNKHS